MSSACHGAGSSKTRPPSHFTHPEFGKNGKNELEVPWFVRTMKLTRFERMTLWMSTLLESHALPLCHSSSIRLLPYSMLGRSKN
jgi:hypothetical protein